MVVTLTPPAPQDENEEIKRIIHATVEEVKLRLPFLQEWSETSLFQLASSVLWEERTRRGFGLADPLHTRWSHALAQNALLRRPVWENQNVTSGVSYAPIPLGDDEKEDDTLYLPYTDRASHTYIMGQTGYGKTTLIEHILLGDFNNGLGGLVIDMHGALIKRLIALMEPERLKDVILIEPGLMEYRLGLNFLEHTSLGIEGDVNRGLDLFERAWGYDSANPSWGPRMSNLLSKSLYVLYANGLSLSELPHYLQSDTLRKKLLEVIPDEGEGHYVRLFWEDFESLRKDEKQKWISPIQNKIYALVQSREMLYMIAQKDSTIDFTKILRDRQIVLLHLDKNLVGGMENVKLLGMAYIGEAMRAAYQRTPGDPSNSHFVICTDEFSAFASHDFEVGAALLRQYGVGLVLANQVYEQLSKTLQQLVDQMGVQITFRCTPDDANRRAHLYQRPPEPLTREQPKRVPVQKPLSGVLSGKYTHANASVMALFNQHEGPLHNLEMDRFFHAVMTKDTQVLQSGFPWQLLITHLNTLLADTPLQSKYASLFWEFHKKQVDAAMQEPENAEAQKELERVNLRLYNLLFSNTEDEFTRYFIQWMKEAYEQIQEEILCLCETLLYTYSDPFDIGFTCIPLLKSLSCFSSEQQLHEAMRYSQHYLAEKRRYIESKIWTWVQWVEVKLEFSIDSSQLKDVLAGLQWTCTYENSGKHDSRTDEEKQAWEHKYGSQFDWIAPKVLVKQGESGWLQASPYDYGDDVFYQAWWGQDKYALAEGQETLFLPFIQPEVDRAFSEAKPIFVQAIRFLREVFSVLAQTPITQQTSEMEQVAYGTKPTSEMRSLMSQELVNLQKYHCFVRLGASDTAAKPLIHVRRPGKGVEGDELDQRITAIREQTKQYGTKPELIEQELEERRRQLGIGGNAPAKAKDTARKDAGPGTRKEAAPVKASRPAGKTAPDSSPAATSVLVFDEDYPTLLYHWHYLSLGQIKRLLRKKPGDTHVAERMKKFVSDGLIGETEYKEAGKPGKPQRIYSLTDTGLRFLEKTRGLTSGSRNMPFSTHTLLANDMLVSLALLPAFAPDYALTGFMHERTYKSKAIALSQGGVEPDGTLVYQYQGQLLTVVCELDLDSENKVQWQAKCEKYIEALHSGLFGPDRVVIAVCQPGGEIKNLLTWTSEILEDHKDLAPLFHFSSASPEKMTPLDFVTGSHWRKPFCTDAAALLETSI